jgi:hypothetical protein
MVQIGYMKHGKGVKSSLVVFMNIKHYTFGMRTIDFQVQEHGEQNIFSNGLILFLPHIT